MMSPSAIGEERPMWLDGPACGGADPEMFFADQPSQLQKAKEICAGCHLVTECLVGALERGEPAGVWGGEIFVEGRIVRFKRPRGRPRKQLVTASAGND
jgi:WhiB family redox-sensing transcriptional regulator